MFPLLLNKSFLNIRALSICCVGTVLFYCVLAQTSNCKFASFSFLQVLLILVSYHFELCSLHCLLFHVYFRCFYAETHSASALSPVGLYPAEQPPVCKFSRNPSAREPYASVLARLSSDLSPFHYRHSSTAFLH